jgi:hypothetical protein
MARAFSTKASHGSLSPRCTRKEREATPNS